MHGAAAAAARLTIVSVDMLKFLIFVFILLLLSVLDDRLTLIANELVGIRNVMERAYKVDVAPP